MIYTDMISDFATQYNNLNMNIQFQVTIPV